MTSTTLKNRALKLLPKDTDPETIHKVVLSSDGGLRVTLVTGNVVSLHDDVDVDHTVEILTGPPPHESIAVSTPVLLEMRTEVAAADAKGTHPRGDTATGQNAGGFDKDGEPLPVVMPKMEAPDPSIVANFESLTPAELEKLAEQIGVEWTGQKDQGKVMEAIVRHNVEFSGDKATGANMDHADTRDGDHVPTVHPAYVNDFEKAVTEPEKAGYRDPDDIPEAATRPSVVGTPEAQAQADAPDTAEQFPEASLAEALANPEGANVPAGDPDAAVPLSDVDTDDDTAAAKTPRPAKLEDLTKATLRARLDAAGVEYRAKDSKATLVDLVRTKRA